MFWRKYGKNYCNFLKNDIILCTVNQKAVSKPFRILCNGRALEKARFTEEKKIDKSACKAEGKEETQAAYGEGIAILKNIQ